MKKIIVAINYAFFDDPKKEERQDVALEVLCTHSEKDIQVVSFNYPWEKIELPCKFTLRNNLIRNSQETIENNRPLPYIKDIDSSVSFQLA